MRTDCDAVRLRNGIKVAGAAKRLLDKMAERGLALRMSDDGAIVAFPKSRLTDSERDQIRACWSDLAAILRTDTPRHTVGADEHSYGVAYYSGKTAWWVR